LTFQIHFIIVY